MRGGVWGDEGFRREGRLTFLLHVESRFNIYMHIYDTEAELQLFGGRKETRGGGGGADMSKAHILILYETVIMKLITLYTN